MLYSVFPRWIIRVGRFEIPMGEVEAGVISDVTTATISYSSENRGQAAQEEPYWGKFGKDHRAHLIAAALGGGGDSGNLFSQDPGVNMGDFKSFEYGIRRVLTEHKDWGASVRISLTYNLPAATRNEAIQAESSSLLRQKYFRPVSVVYEVTYFNADFEDQYTIIKVFPN